MISSGQKDLMICPHCDNYYEYVGEVCPEGGKFRNKSGIFHGRKTLYGEDDCLSRTNQPKETQKEKGDRPSTTEEDVDQLSLFDVS